MEERTKDNLIRGASLVTLLSKGLSHTACVASGIYKGFMDAKGVNVDIPFRYLLGANTFLTGMDHTVTAYEEKRSITNKKTIVSPNYQIIPPFVGFINGSIRGAIAAPLEFLAGWVVGYIPGKAFS